MSQRECHNEWCQTQHLSNYSISVQYGDEIKPTPCPCECHLDEQNIHGEYARKVHNNPIICLKCNKKIENPRIDMTFSKEMCNDCSIKHLLSGGSIKAQDTWEKNYERLTT